MEIKPGWKTTEFWSSLTTMISGILTMCGVFTPGDAQNFSSGVTQIVGGFITVVPIVAYAFSRGIVKSASR